MEVEYAVIGGSYAGMSAALQLARARRSVAVIDAGLRRNRFAAESHGFLAQDGRPPGEIAEEAKRQLLQYPNVRWLEGEAQTARRLDEAHFEVQGAQHTLQAQRLILATGVVDEMPPLEGLAERWGRSVFHCPYCHGYELGGGAIGVLAANPLAQHHALMLPDWGTVTLFLNGNYTPDVEQLAALQRRGVEIEAVPVLRLSGHADVVLVDGRVRSMAGLFTQARTRMASTLAEQLGCAFEEGPTGPYIRTDGMQQTSVPGVFACGDAARAAGNVAISVGEGAMAGAAAHRSMMA